MPPALPLDLAEMDIPASINTLHELFQYQADRSPDAIALIGTDETVSYRELDQRSNQFARYIQDQGVGRGDLVGLFCRRSVGAIVSMLGILKSGAAYVPLDELWPDDRIEGILRDAKVRTLVADAAFDDRLKLASSMKVVVRDRDEVSKAVAEKSPERIRGSSTGEPSSRTEAHDGLAGSDLCYIIYTSGTTGRPKGIMTEHRNVVAFTRAFRQTCEMTADDRVYQGFSLTFDGSVEEIWMAFSSGAALVIGPPELARLAEETGDYLRQQKVSFFSTVPTFLAMIPEGVSSLRLVVVSGEACPPALIERWVRPGLRMLNVYGPTETTVNATSWDCVTGAAVTIGRTLPGYVPFILDESMREVPAGEPGELYIGGAGVARGYLNRPDLTERSFVANPLAQTNSHGGQGCERLYRTGDLVQWSDDGELIFHGRIDGQVKVRGYRIELGEIETVLREHPSIDAAVATVFDRGGTQELAAFATTTEGVGGALPRGEILELLRERLPAYMVPSYFDAIDELPRLTSGKIDRRALPDPGTRLIESEREIVPPASATERTVAAAWERVLGLSPISVEDDFFLNLGGDSLSAVEVAAQIRNSLDENIGVREVYQFPTVRAFAKHADGQTAGSAPEGQSPQPEIERKPANQVFAEQSRWSRWACIALQALSLQFIYGLPIVMFGGMVWLYLAAIEGIISIPIVLTVLAGLFFGGLAISLTLSLLVKWVVIGRFKAGSYPIYSVYYFRWWLVTRFIRASGAGLLVGTPLANIYLRLMGAKVGKGCVIHTAHFATFDLLEIGDGTCIGSESQLLGYDVADGMLTLGPITLGRGCYVGIQSAVAVGAEMGDDSRLDDLSLLAAGEAIPADGMMHGSPAQAGEVSVPDVPKQGGVHRRSFVFGVLSVLAIYAGQLFMLAASLPSLLMLYLAYTVSSYWLWGLVLLVSIPLFDISFWILHIVVKACVLHRAKPGVYPVDSLYFMRKWFVDALLGLSRRYTLPVYTTLYMPPLLRRLGAKIGPRAELSVIVQMAPDLIEMGSESFFADGSIIGGMKLHRGHFELARNRIGRRSFVGNSAVLPVGGSIGNGCLLGVLSTPPQNGEIPDKTEWLGSPSFVLPHRRVVEGFTDEDTYKPPTRLFVARLFVDALRIVIAGAIEILGVIAVLAAAFFAYESVPLGVAVLLAPLVGIATALGMAACVVILKKFLFEAFEPVIRPLWSPYVWFNEVLNGAYESVAAPILRPLLGTPFFAIYLRFLGCRIGKHCFLDTTLFGEFDLVEIGDYAALNHDVVVQNHLFEDRIFKSSHLSIGDGCSIGHMSVILYDSKVGSGSTIGSLSLVMKGESIPPNSNWEGIPVRRKEGTSQPQNDGPEPRK